MNVQPSCCLDVVVYMLNCVFWRHILLEIEFKSRVDMGSESQIAIGILHSGITIEILDLECVLCHVTGVQNENKNALINPPSWIFPRSVVYKMSWGEFNLPL